MARSLASFSGSNTPIGIKTGPSKVDSVTDPSLETTPPKSAAKSSLTVLGGGSFPPDIMTLMAPGSSESRKIPSQSISSTADGFVG
jgi:hypothetical protein